MAVSELDRNQAHYLADYQFRGDYNRILTERVMAALAHVLDEEKVQPVVRHQLEGILSGNTGKVQLTDVAVGALFEADLLSGVVSSTAQTDDPGWRHLDERLTQEYGRPTRYQSYFVRSLDALQGRAVAYSGVRLEAEEVTHHRKRDFTRWVLARDLA